MNIKWEKIGIVFSIIAVIITFGFSVLDKWDYKKQLAITSYDKLYSDVSQGHYSGKKLEDAIKRILDNGDNVSGMNLSKKWLPGIVLKDENLYAIDFSESVFYSKKKFCNFSNSNLMNSNFRDANLRGADLQGANLQGTNLWGVNLQGANLQGTNLEGAILIEANLEEALTLYKAKLDPELLAQIQEKCPHLLEKPDWTKKDIK